MDYTTRATEDLLRSRLRETGARAQVVPVLGAGMSHALGLPLGMDLAHGLHAQARSLIRSRGLELGALTDSPPGFYELMEAVQSMLERPQWEALVKRALQVPDPSQWGSERWDHLRAILAWRPAVLATTNLDRALEAGMKFLGIPHSVICIDPEAADGLRTLSEWSPEGGDDGSPPVRLIKLHGDVEVPSTWVLSRPRYRDFTHHPIVRSAIGQLASQKSLLFLGYSLADEDILRPLEEMVWRAESDQPHFVVLGRTGREVPLSPGVHRLGALPVIWEAGPGYKRLLRRVRELFEPETDGSVFHAYFDEPLRALQSAFAWSDSRPSGLVLEGARALLSALVLAAEAERAVPPGFAALVVHKLAAEEREALRLGRPGEIGRLRVGSGAARERSFQAIWPVDAKAAVRVGRYARALLSGKRAWPFTHQVGALLVDRELRLPGPDLERVRQVFDGLLRDALAEPIEERAELLWSLVGPAQVALELRLAGALLMQARPLCAALGAEPGGERWSIRAAKLARNLALEHRQEGRFAEAVSAVERAASELLDLRTRPHLEAGLRQEATDAYLGMLVDLTQLWRARGDSGQAQIALTRAHQGLADFKLPNQPIYEQSLTLEKARLLYEQGRAGDALEQLARLAEPLADASGRANPELVRRWRWNAVSALVFALELHLEAGQLDRAAQALTQLQRLEGAEGLNVPMGIGYPTYAAGLLAEADGRLDEAAEAYRAAEDIFQTYGYTAGAVLLAQRRLAMELLQRPYRAPHAIDKLRDATAAALSTGQRAGAVRAVVASAQALLGALRTGEAHALLVDLRRQIGPDGLRTLPPHLQASLYFAEADVALELGFLEGARIGFDAAEQISVPDGDREGEASPIFSTMPVRSCELLERRARLARHEANYSDAQRHYGELASRARREGAVELEVKALLAQAELLKSGICRTENAQAPLLDALDSAERLVEQAKARLQVARPGPSGSGMGRQGLRAGQVQRLELQAEVLYAGICQEKALRVVSGAPISAESRRQRNAYRDEAAAAYAHIVQSAGADEQARSAVGKAWFGLGALEVDRALDLESDSVLSPDELASITELYERGVRLCLEGGAAAHAVQELVFIVYLWYQQSWSAPHPWERAHARETSDTLLALVLTAPQLHQVLATPEGTAFLRLSQAYGALARRDFPRARAFVAEASAIASSLGGLEAAESFIREATDKLAAEAPLANSSASTSAPSPIPILITST